MRVPGGKVFLLFDEPELLKKGAARPFKYRVALRAEIVRTLPFQVEVMQEMPMAGEVDRDLSVRGPL